jgi:hypothetical protein
MLMIHAVLFAIVFQGLAILAACMVLRMALPKVGAVTIVLRYITNPVYSSVAAITPAVLPPWCHGALAIFWLLSLRLGFYLMLGAFGLLPPVPPT